MEKRAKEKGITLPEHGGMGMSHGHGQMGMGGMGGMGGNGAHAADEHAH